MLTTWRDINKGWPARGLIEKETERAQLKSIIHWGEKWEEEVIRIIVCIPKAVSLEKWYQDYTLQRRQTALRNLMQHKPTQASKCVTISSLKGGITIQNWIIYDLKCPILNKNHKACREIGKCDANTRKNLVKNNLALRKPFDLMDKGFKTVIINIFNSLKKIMFWKLNKDIIMRPHQVQTTNKEK